MNNCYYEHKVLHFFYIRIVFIVSDVHNFLMRMWYLLILTTMKKKNCSISIFSDYLLFLHMLYHVIWSRDLLFYITFALEGYLLAFECFFVKLNISRIFLQLFFFWGQFLDFSFILSLGSCELPQKNLARSFDSNRWA